MDPFKTTLGKLRIRLALQQWLTFCATVLFYTASAACLWVVVTRLFPQFGDGMRVSVALMIGGAVTATLWSIYRRPSLVRAALEADKRLGLKERLTSSLELEAVEGEMLEALHADARRQMAGLNFSRHFPLSANRAMRWVYVPLLAFGLTYLFLPEFDLFGQREREALAKEREQAVDVRVERLKSAVKALEAQPEWATASISAEMIARIDKLAEELKTGEITEKQALARLSDLSQEMAKHREAMAKENETPKLAGDMNQLQETKELAKALQDGRMKDAMEKLRELKEKLKEGELSAEQAEKLAKELKSLSEMMGGPQSELGEAMSKALADASAALESKDATSAAQAMEAMELAMEDLESILDQLEMMDVAMAEVGEWQSSLMPASEYCRVCGEKLAEGERGWGVCSACRGQGLGLMGAGLGQGNQVGEMPEVQVGFQPTKLSGPMTKGKMLADILQKTAPEGDAIPTVEMITGAFVEVQQEAEQALTQEEIPPASKEYVRQYFGSLEPENQGAGPQ